MKTLKTMIAAMAILFTMNVSGQNNKTILDLKTAKQSDVLNSQELMESVVFIRDFTAFQEKSSKSKPITIEIVNYHPSKKLLPAYMIDGIEYNDNGKFNDEIAGDGVFTSVKKVVVKGLTKDVSLKYSAATSFKYQSESRGISFGCKVRTVTCPETNWWNSCWPVSSPCTCVEFYDCEFEIGIE